MLHYKMTVISRITNGHCLSALALDAVEKALEKRGRGGRASGVVDVLVVVDNAIYRAELRERGGDAHGAMADIRRYYTLMIAMVSLDLPRPWKIGLNSTRAFSNIFSWKNSAICNKTPLVEAIAWHQIDQKLLYVKVTLRNESACELFNVHGLTEIKAWISNHSHGFMWNVITHPRP